MIGNYGEMDMLYDAAANPEGFTSFNTYGGWGDTSSSSSGASKKHATLQQLKHRLRMLESKLKQTTSASGKQAIRAEIKNVKKHLAMLKKHSHGLRGSSGPGIHGRSGPNHHIQRSGIRGGSGRSNRIQRNAIKRRHHHTKVLRQGQQQGETAYSEDDSGELTDADISADLSEDGLDDGSTDAVAGWGNWGMGQAFGSTYMTLYGGGFGLAPASVPTGQLAGKIRQAKAQLAHYEVQKRSASGSQKKAIKAHIHALKKHIRALEKEERQLASHHHILGIGKRRDGSAVALHAETLAKKAAKARRKRLLAYRHAHKRHPLMRHGVLHYPRPGQIPMQQSPFGPQPPPGVLLQGQRPGASAFYPRGRPEAGGNVNDYFDTSAEGQALTPGADDPTGAGVDDMDTDSGSDTDWGELAKWGLGLGAVIAVIAVISNKNKKKSKSKSSESAAA